MDREKLYELLDIEEPADFKYFENLAAYLESDDDIVFEDIALVIKGCDKAELSAIIDEYFEDITNYVPANETEIYTMLENVKKSLVGMSRNIEDDSTETKLIEELERFRQFYSINSRVYCTDRDKWEEKEVPIRDAVVLARLEAMGDTSYEFDYSECGGYPLEDYVMSFADMISYSEREDELDQAQAEIERNILGSL